LTDAGVAESTITFRRTETATLVACCNRAIDCPNAALRASASRALGIIYARKRALMAPGPIWESDDSQVSLACIEGWAGLRGIIRPLVPRWCDAARASNSSSPFFSQRPTISEALPTPARGVHLPSQSGAVVERASSLQRMRTPGPAIRRTCAQPHEPGRALSIRKTSPRP